MGLFGKKKKDPPLPEQLPPMPEPPAPESFQMPPVLDNSEMQTSTHDQIPNDIGLNISPRNILEDLSPNNLPHLDEPSESPFSESIPPHVEATELPKIPDIRQAEDSPLPQLDTDVPKPPPIFSEEGFYDTPHEVKHLATNPEYIQKYNLRDAQEYRDEPSMEKPATQHLEGPLFVEIEAFKTMLRDIDDIKNKLKASSDIMKHLNEIKNAKDQELERWRVSLEDLQKKVSYIDNIVFKEAP